MFPGCQAVEGHGVGAYVHWQRTGIGRHQEGATPHLVTTTRTPLPRAPATAGRWLFPIGLFLAVSAVLVVVVWQTGVHLPRWRGAGPPGRNIPGGRLTEGWVRWDAGWYLAIAQKGYSYMPGSQSSVAFFPAYPLTLKVVAGLIGSTFLAGMAVTWASGLGAAVLFWHWCRVRLTTRAAQTALVLLLVFPYAWFLHLSIYADALFVVAVLGSFTLLDHDHPVLAGMVAAVATAARPVGVALVIGLVVRALERRGALRLPESGWLRLPNGIRLERLRPTDAGVLLSLTGLGAWCTYLWVRFGDPLAFAAVQAAPGWEQTAGPRTWLKIAFLGELVHGPRLVALRLFVQALLTLGALVLVPLVARRFGWGYAAFTLAVVALPAISTKDFQGMGRYLLAAFPCFALVGELLAERPRLRVGVVLASGLGLVFLTSMSAQGYYLT